MTSLPEYVAATLVVRAAELSVHWRARARAATPRGANAVASSATAFVPPRERTAGIADAAPDHAAHAPSDAPGVAATDARGTADAALVRAIAAGLTKDARPAGEVIRLGWSEGVAAHAAGLSLHHVHRDADLLVAVLLAEVERVVAELPADVAGSAAAGLAVARRLDAMGARYAQAAVSGFLHERLTALRAHWRTLRHDLRNPIGTIQGALALMEDEALPPETRNGPRVRAMVARNAESLAALVTSGLDDRGAASVLLGAPQPTALRDAAIAARREVREAARLSACTLEVSEEWGGTTARLDAGTLELGLTTLLLAGIAVAQPGDAVRVESVGPRAGAAPGGALGRAPIETSDGREAATIRLRHEGATVEPEVGGAGASGAGGTERRIWWDADGLALAASVLEEMGGELRSEGGAHAGRRTRGASLAGCPALVLVLPLGREDDARFAAPPSADARAGGPAEQRTG